MTMKKDKQTCSSCDAWAEGENKIRGYCHLAPPIAQRDDQVDSYPLVMGDNVGCMQHSKRQGPTK